MRATFLIFGFVCLLPVSLQAGDVKTEFDPAKDFSAYSTYSFVSGSEMTNTGLLADPHIRERLFNFIAGALDHQGYKEVPLDQPHTLAVRFWVARKAKTEESVFIADPWYGGYPMYWNGPWAGGYEEYVVRNYVEGTLVVDLIDTATRELVWRTYLRQEIEDRTAAYNEAKKKLYKSFADLPPSASAKEKMYKQRVRLEKEYTTK
jgi:hypothetical protein